MKYPREVGPTTQTELYAWLFSMLGNAYNMLAQYEADEFRREDARRREVFEDGLTKARERVPHPEPHREDEP